MSSAKPRVSIGLPVYNGGALLAGALDCWLAQTYTDFELIICDNASTDDSGDIARRYAAADPRISYHRNSNNLGAANNFNRAFELSCGEYFKWAAHDDLYHPEFLARCVEALDAAPPSVVLCTPQTELIDNAGQSITRLGFAACRRAPGVSNGTRLLRFNDVLRLRSEHITEVIWGLRRAPALARTRLFIPFHSGDLILAAELALIGDFWQTPGHFIQMRPHPRNIHIRNRAEENNWWGLKHESGWRLPLPLKLFFDHLNVIQRAELPFGQKLYRYTQMTAYLDSRLRKQIRRVNWRVRAALTAAAAASARYNTLPLRAWAFIQFIKLGSSATQALLDAAQAPADVLHTAAAAPQKQDRRKTLLLLLAKRSRSRSDNSTAEL